MDAGELRIKVVLDEESLDAAVARIQEKFKAVAQDVTKSFDAAVKEWSIQFNAEGLAKMVHLAKGRAV